jgi:hypothetical protein
MKLLGKYLRFYLPVFLLTYCSHELYAEWLVRKKAYRAARHSLKDCISTYRRMSAYGKANHVASKYEWLLRGGASLTTVDAAVQTSVVDTGNTAFRLEQNEDSQYMGAETAVDRTQNWIGKFYLRSYPGCYFIFLELYQALTWTYSSRDWKAT